MRILTPHPERRVRIGWPSEKWDFGPAELRAWADLWGALEDLTELGVRSELIQDAHARSWGTAVDGTCELEDTCAWLHGYTGVVAALREVMRRRPMGVEGPTVPEDGFRPALETYGARLAFLRLDEAAAAQMDLLEEDCDLDDYYALDLLIPWVITGDCLLEVGVAWLRPRYPSLARLVAEYGAVRPAPMPLGGVTAPNLETLEALFAEDRRQRAEIAERWRQEEEQSAAGGEDAMNN